MDSRSRQACGAGAGQQGPQGGGLGGRVGEALCCNGTCPLGVGSVGATDLSGLWTLRTRPW